MLACLSLHFLNCEAEANSVNLWSHLPSRLNVLIMIINCMKNNYRVYFVTFYHFVDFPWCCASMAMLYFKRSPSLSNLWNFFFVKFCIYSKIHHDIV